MNSDFTNSDLAISKLGISSFGIYVKNSLASYETNADKT